VDGRASQSFSQVSEQMGGVVNAGGVGAWTIAAHSAGFGRMRDQSTGTSR
jgi:hypothetical protein